MKLLQALGYQKRLCPCPAMAIAACAEARGQCSSAPRPLRSQPCHASGRCGMGRSGARLLTLPSVPCHNGWFDSMPDPFLLSLVPTAVAYPSS